METPPDPEARQAVETARHLERPSAMTYMRSLLEPFVELHGDLLNSDDRSIVGGRGVTYVGNRGHTDPKKAATALQQLAFIKQLGALSRLSEGELLKRRYR